MVNAAEPGEVVTVTLRHVTHEIFVEVKDEDGFPVEGATVVLGQLRAHYQGVTGADGACRLVVNVDGEIDSVPGFSPRTSAIFPTTLLPGKWPPVPVFAPWPHLKCMAWTRASFSSEKPNFPDAYS